MVGAFPRPYMGRSRKYRRNDVILWRNSSRFRVKDECHTSCMKRRMPEIYADPTLGFPFRSARTARALRSGIQNINWTKQCVKSFDRDVRLRDAVKSRVWSDARVVQQETIMSLRCSLKGKRPEHGVDHLRPHSYAVQKKSYGRECEHLVLILDDAVLMVSSNGAEGDFLIGTVNVVEESLVSEHAVVGMIMFHTPSRLQKHFFEGFCREDCLVDGEISHKVHVHEIADVIAKCRATPNSFIR